MTDARHTGFFGQTGTGKSHEVKRRLAQHERVVVIDVNDEFSESSTRRKGPLRDAMTLDELRQHPSKLAQPTVSIALVGFSLLEPRGIARAVVTIARLQERIAKETGQPPPRLLLVLDECGSYARHCEATLAALATAGGQHLSITVWVVAQRPVLVPKTVRSQMKDLVLFHMAEPADLETVEERTHDPRVSELVRQLPETFTRGKKPFISWSANGAKGPELPAPQPVASREPNEVQTSE